MSGPKKTRGGDSLHNALSPEQREKLAAWLTLDNLTYEDARALVESEFGVKTSADALRRFYSSFAVPWQYAQAKGDAEAFGSLLEGKFGPATIKRAEQLAFVALTDKTPNLNAAKALLKMVGDSAKLQVARDRLSLDADKFRQLVKTEAEKGLDALHLELKGDAVALALFEQMRARVMAALEAKQK